MGLTNIQAKLVDDDGKSLVVEDWPTIVDNWGDRINLYRQYVRGDQRLELPQNLAELMGITKQEAERFNVNYCGMVVKKLSNRLKLERVQGSTDEGTLWSDRMLKANRFDALQIDIHKAAIGDGDAFLMVDPESLETGEFAKLVKEPAYNGDVGVIAVYDETKRDIVAAIKIWESPGLDRKRVNIYFDDHVERYVDGEEGLQSYGDDIEWIDDTNKTPLGVPFFHFKNDAEEGMETGISHIKSAISLSDGLNRTILDIIGAAGLTTAPLKYGINVAADWTGDVRQGGMLVFTGCSKEDHPPQVGTFAQGEVKPLIDAANTFIDQIGAITETPLPDTMGSSASSGESLKQRSEGQVAMAETLQTKFGNVWEDVVEYARMIQQAMGNTSPPESDSWNAVWKSAQIRNDAEIIANANAIADYIDHRTYLETIAPVFGWDSAMIDKIMERRQAEVASVNNPPVPPGTPTTPFVNGNDLAELAAAASGAVAQ